METLEKRQGLRIACLEEIAYNQGWISRETLSETAAAKAQNSYGSYLRELAGK